ncbi:MAG: hypothetical protein EB059_03960 [Alphaproteobacteria bacterium]|nr:hypothetical protein [Alphaproteobacteria bacterium]
MRFLLNISQAIEQAKDLCRTGKYQDALMALDAARIRHNHPALFIEMARIFSELANNDAAGKILQVALGQFPNDITVIIAYANYAYQSNQPALGLAVTTPLLDTPLCTLDLKLTHAHLLKAGNHDADAQAIYKSVLEKERRGTTLEWTTH